jgi:ferredoxin/flavodoxin
MPKYNRLILYYFTGTGNALKVARWIEEFAREKNIGNIILQPIDRDYKPDISEIEGKTLIGFLYPTHGFNLPPAMLKFIRKFSKFSDADVFTINTRAGGKFFKWVTPGLSGSAHWLAMLLLKFKGYKVLGGYPIDMPSNWISIHPGLPDSWVKFIVAKCEIKTKEIAEKLLMGKKVFTRILIDLPIDLLIFPITILYFLIGRFFLAKTFIHSANCNECHLCVDKCPVGAISIVDNRPYWTKDCESCMRCISICPKKSIQSSHLMFGLYFVFISVIPLTPFLYNQFEFLRFLDNYYINLFINSYFILGFMLGFYFLTHRLFKLKFINQLFTYTSLTKYWKGYRAPGISAKDYKTKTID